MPKRHILEVVNSADLQKEPEGRGRKCGQCILISSVYLDIEGRARGQLQATRRSHMFCLLPHPTECGRDSLKEEAERGAQEEDGPRQYSVHFFTPMHWFSRSSFMQLKGSRLCHPKTYLFAIGLF